MTAYVLDASAWLRLFLADGPMPPGLEAAAVQVDQGASAFVAPELILVEAAHALNRKSQRGFISSKERDALWAALRRTPMDLLPIHEHVDRALALSGEHRISTYDALYVAIAEHLGAPLLTADAALAKVALRL
jgi:predicted nucleic acid-binding protein